jgi:hypothetical protein
MEKVTIPIFISRIMGDKFPMPRVLSQNTTHFIIIAIRDHRVPTIVMTNVHMPRVPVIVPVTVVITIVTILTITIVIIPTNRV